MRILYTALVVCCALLAALWRYDAGTQAIAASAPVRYQYETATFDSFHARKEAKEWYVNGWEPMHQSCSGALVVITFRKKT